ncbi:hypothetical protein CLOM_g13718 [Closterium sp. NIES-68]|nr:hypothetical protein CLOM_g3786 [Closterium sp. NIES-68]GJP54657.1 hypothetical protein CLOM_g13718 [Closterium sp. NIES-68]GJP73508.1 hypothetical protein CLOP_g4212 [Closterium sp. NIES-67]
MLTAAVSIAAIASLLPPVTSDSSTQQQPQRGWKPQQPARWTACDYSRGWWIRKPAPSAPYGSSCPFLKDVGPVNCINRPKRRSLSWLGYRWWPAACQVPAYGFRPFHFLEMMRNRVIASVGDSLSYENLMPSLLCHIHGASPVTEIPNDGSLAVLQKRSRVYRVQAYNVTLINTWSTFLNEYWQDELTLSRYSGGKNRTAEDSVINLDGVDPALAARVTKYDVLILQTAAHWQAKPNKWRRYFVDGQGRRVFTERQYIAAFERGMRAIVALLNRTNPTTPAVARTPVPFFLSAPAKINRCKGHSQPLTYARVLQTRYKIPQYTRWLPAQQRTVKGTRIRLLDVTSSSLYRPDSFVGSGGINNDCVHYCLPGVPDSWVDMLHNMLSRQTIFRVPKGADIVR